MKVNGNTIAIQEILLAVLGGAFVLVLSLSSMWADGLEHRVEKQEVQQDDIRVRLGQVETKLNTVNEGVNKLVEWERERLIREGRAPDR